MELSVVIPVYNEAPTLEPLVRELREALAGIAGDHEIIAVDDGSTDSSFEVLVRLRREEPRLRVIRLRRNFGQTAALAAGFDHARGRVVISLDADLQNDPRDIPRLLEPLERGYDLVNGWRRERADPWLTRRLPSAVANWVIGLVTGVRLHDCGCTLRAVRAEVARQLGLYGELHRFIPALAADLGAAVTEVAVRHRPRVAGRSKYGISRTVRVLLDLLTVKFLSGYSTRPIQIFGLVGLALTLVGGAGTLYLGIRRLFFHVHLANRPVLLLVILLVLIGVQFISIGLLGEMVARTYHESQAKPIYLVREVLE